LITLVLSALVATRLPNAHAEAPTVTNGTDIYYYENGTCHVHKEIDFSSLTPEQQQDFTGKLGALLKTLGHESEQSWANGTLSLNSTADCPPGLIPIPTKKVVIDGWAVPAVAVSTGLVMVVAVSLATTVLYEKLSGHSLEEQGQAAKAIMAVGGFLSTALLTFVVGGGNWQVTLSSAVTAFFTTYLVAAYGFGGLQTLLRSWITTAFTYALGLCQDRERGDVGALERDTVEAAAQVRG
jgi:hypothetical protein